MAPLAPVVQRARQLLDLDADPDVIHEWLDRSALLRPLLAAAPGLRLVGTYDAFETGVLAILQQGASIPTAASVAGRVATTYGTPLDQPNGGITHLFPTPSQLTDTELKLAPQRRATIVEFAKALQTGKVTLDGSADPETATRQLLTVPGIGSRTASILAMRALRDPDAFPTTDAALRRRVSSLSTRPQISLNQISQQWRPWRGYAAMHLWAHHTAT